MKNLILSFCSLILLSFTEPSPKKVIFFGDSITQQGLSNPKGYLNLIKADILNKGKGSNFEILGAGIGGNKIYDLFLRLESDVLAQKPDIVYIFVGVNDVWHKSTYGTGTDLDKFEKFYKATVDKLQAQNIRVIISTMGVIGERTDHSNPQDGDLNLYAKAIRKIATEKNCELIDLRKAFLDYNLQNNKDNVDKGILTTDRVHLNEAGNQLVASLFLKPLLP